ncbi:MAG TPA: cyclic pyranopterin monophosphate synthase MoaC [Pirellulales bacterium]|jgi:cyclic pyranopterin phosphate synthase|nr:cyclic pyranopterin monophosphate synthase MoaC [Pirellulales bacterium]
MSELTHFDAQGASRMVDVAAKPITFRHGRATGSVRMRPSTLALVRDRKLSKGDVLEVARLAGIMAAKRTFELIPLCHQIPLEAIALDFAFPDSEHVAIEARASATARTGVEMEALVAASVAALTIYDMCKAVDRDIVIEQIQLDEKSGGASGHYRRVHDS